jgi:ribonuclease J
MVDGLGIGDVGSIVLKDRQHLSQDGLIIVVLAMDKSTGEIVSGPDIISRGFVYIRESENLMEDMKQALRYRLKEIQENNITDWSVIKIAIKETLRDILLQKNRRNPMVLPIIMEV